MGGEERVDCWLRLDWLIIARHSSSGRRSEQLGISGIVQWSNPKVVGLKWKDGGYLNDMPGQKIENSVKRRKYARQ